MTRFDDAHGNGDMLMTATGPGRSNWTREGGGAEAAALAEQVVDAIRQDQPGASRFMRVDLVRRNDGSGGWWLNELEFFGNAQLIFEVFDNASDLLDAVVACTKRWVRSLVH
jgi:hypothetical protein